MQGGIWTSNTLKWKSLYSVQQTYSLYGYSAMVLNPLNPFESIESFESRENSDSLNPVPGRIQLNLNPASNLNPIQSNTGL